MSAHDVGWGAVNQSVLDDAERLIRDSRTKPAILIRQTHHLSTLSTVKIRSPAPADVAHLLNQAGVDFVITGGHALSVYTKEARGTGWVEVIVSDARKAATALRALKSKRLRVRVDPLHGATFANRRRVTIDGKRAWIPTLPAMLALKFQAMSDLSRHAVDRFRDEVDIFQVLHMQEDADIDAALELVVCDRPMIARNIIDRMKRFQKTGEFRPMGRA